MSVCIVYTFRMYWYVWARTHDEEMFPVGSSAEAAGPDGVQLKAAAEDRTPGLAARLTPD